MDAEERRVTIDRHEWVLKSPAHHTELEKTVAVAERKRAELATRRVRTGDVHVSAADDEVIVSFEAQRPKVATRGREGDRADA
ncbi:hypothetical protein RI578_06655 [Streptomyces sp. BB1-1-1]|uniref:hypothetical protein n=1 Tax=Streptomyces sp. BB1-1-1 TaxID=3074430 RepID=UPI002877AC88|nr:hypothetical protein [Streptomyces sp. BB1-1-1]WND33993.1 hypothetical protein RI578_06655 [Streptomyces sp. BB1-1-1]